ncbi:MAG: dihydroorotate dehydrogenase electron transfer subunit [Ignavibacteriaceae bacterium]|nr:dihydroorotate dehydrogenase electron transfer subunit [Ignavibacteriaceae bacterium]
MFIYNSAIEKIIALENNIFLLKAHCPEIASTIQPGQFLNIKVSETTFPLLRRPFSVCDVEGDSIFIMFNILGEGTKLLQKKHIGDTLNIIGPLGNGFSLGGNFETAVIVAGGLGSAPFPYFIKKLNMDKKIACFVGGKSEHDVIQYGMRNVKVSTDDGSLGFKGNVVELLQQELSSYEYSKIKIFGCGPTAMLRSLREFTIKNNIECEVSTECAMACGFGICMGCPTESAKQNDKYLLVCKDGPVFNVKDVVI